MNTFGPPRHLGGGIVNAYCPVCDARSSFEPVKNGGSEATLSTENSSLQNHYDASYTTFTYKLLSCNGCSLGALAEFRKLSSSIVTFNDFYPSIKQKSDLPKNTPKDIAREFRSAEECANIDEYRPAGAMLRSVIEKVLQKNGYVDELEYSLSGKLMVLKKDNVLPVSVSQKNEELVKILGDEILHKEFRDISSDEFITAKHYTLKFLDAFYDDHKIVMGVLKEKGRLDKHDKPVIPSKEKNGK